MGTRPESVREWAHHLHSIYGSANERKTWLHFSVLMSTHACLVMSPKYYAGPGNFEWQFCKTMAWLLNLHNSQAKPHSADSEFSTLRDPGVLLLSEFPKACPYCRLPECNYDDALHHSRIRKQNRGWALNQLIKLRETHGVARLGMSDWATIVLNIYPRDRERPLPELAGKLAEEFAELVTALLDYRADRTDASRAGYCEEFADFFSRLCVFGARVIGTVPPSGTVGGVLDTEMWNMYEAGCPTCHGRWTEGQECVCHTRRPPDRERDLFDLFGSDTSKHDETRGSSVTVINTASAAATSVAHGGSVFQTLLELQSLAAEDADEVPALVKNVAGLGELLREGSGVGPTEIGENVDAILGNAPRERVTLYAKALRRFLEAILTSAMAGPLAEKIQEVLLHIPS